MTSARLSVMAIAAHPDDIEFGMAGTLCLLRDLGAELHYCNVADGCCGSNELSGDEISSLRLQEAKAAAALLDAMFYPPLAHDLEIFYNRELLAQLAGYIRRARPDILLVPSLEDYMEDHMNTARLAVSAAFCRGVPNFPTDPVLPPVDKPIVVYHAQPHGNRDPMDRPVRPAFVVDITEKIDLKTDLLACHASQKTWLDQSQGMDAYLDTMKELSAEVGAMAGLPYGEGWRRHNPLGFDPSAADPLAERLLPTVVPTLTERTADDGCDEALR